MSVSRDDDADLDAAPNGIEKTLRRMVAIEHEVLAEAASSAVTSEAARIEEWVRGPCQGRDADGSRSPKTRRRSRLVIGVASIGALVVFVAAWQLLDDGDRQPTFLGPVPKLLAPVGHVTSFAEFQWQIPGGLPPDGHCLVQIWSEDSTPLAQSPQIVNSTSWRPPREQLELWPNSIKWRVVIYRNRDAWGISPWVSATR